MNIIDQQIQAIKDAYEVADIVLKQMYKDAFNDPVTITAQLALRYQDGRRNALRDVIDELGIG